jgi:hypothetical protein
MNLYIRCVYAKYPNYSKFCSGHSLYTGQFLTFHSGLSERRKARRRNKKTSNIRAKSSIISHHKLKRLPGSLILLRFKYYIQCFFHRCVNFRVYFRNYFLAGHSFYIGAFQQLLPGFLSGNYSQEKQKSKKDKAHIKNKSHSL